MFSLFSSRLLKVLPALLGLSVLVQTSAQTTSPAAQDVGAQEAAARKLLFQSCGGVESAALPTGVRPGVYRGTLGSQKITLELIGKPPTPGGEHTDRYSYDRYGTDIALERGRPGNRTAARALLGVEAVFGGDEPVARGCLDLSADGNTLRGQWRTPDGGKRLPVTLSPVDVAALPLALPTSPGLLKLRAADPYTFVKLNRPWVKVAGGLREPFSGVSYPRVAGGPAALNTALQDHQLALVGDALDCLSDDGVNLTNGTDYQAEGALSWKSARLLSLHEEVGYFCGGAHPDNYTAGVTLDARSGHEVTLAAKPGTLWPGLGAAKLQALYLARYPRTPGTDAQDASDDAECLNEVSGDEGRDAEYGLPYALYLTPQGLAVWPTYLPHVVSACAEVVTLPYASLRGLANPQSPYFRDLYAR